MVIPVHDTQSGWVVAYAESWGFNQPALGSYLSVDEARARFESGAPLEVAEVAEREGDRVVRCRWVVGMTRPRHARAHLRNAAGSVVASVTYTQMDNGRLFVSQRVDYVYPDQEREYAQYESLITANSYFNTDGTGVFDVYDKRSGQPVEYLTRFKDADFSSLWFDWPVFGEWDMFADPASGVLPEDFAMTPL